MGNEAAAVNDEEQVQNLRSWLQFLTLGYFGNAVVGNEAAAVNDEEQVQNPRSWSQFLTFGFFGNGAQVPEEQHEQDFPQTWFGWFGAKLMDVYQFFFQSEVDRHFGGQEPLRKDFYDCNRKINNLRREMAKMKASYSPCTQAAREIKAHVSADTPWEAAQQTVLGGKNAYEIALMYNELAYYNIIATESIDLRNDIMEIINNDHVSQKYRMAAGRMLQNIGEKLYHQENDGVQGPEMMARAKGSTKGIFYGIKSSAWDEPFEQGAGPVDNNVAANLSELERVRLEREVPRIYLFSGAVQESFYKTQNRVT